MAVIKRLFCIAGHSASSVCCRVIFYTIRPLNDTSRPGATPGQLGGDFELLLEAVGRENRYDRRDDEPFACCRDYLFIYSQLSNEGLKDTSTRESGLLSGSPYPSDCRRGSGPAFSLGTQT